MKAVVMTRYGDNGVVEIRDVPAPEPGPTDLLIEVHAAGLNPLDYKIRDGALKLIRRFSLPAVMGNELAGVVVKTGASVKRFKIGDEVFARVAKDKLGALAELAAVDQDFCALKPTGIPMVAAAGVPLAGLTAYQALHEELHVVRGQRLFVPAGAGGVGIFAIQLARIAGVKVATTASGKGLDLVRSLGADVVIDYKNERLEDKIRDLDAVFDTLGGDELAREFALVKRGGAVCSVAGKPEPATARKMGAGPVVTGLFWLASRRERGLARRHGVRYSYLFMRPDGAQLKELAGYIDDGRLRVIVDRTFPLAQAKEALAYLETGRAKGKVVVTLR